MIKNLKLKFCDFFDGLINFMELETMVDNIEQLTVGCSTIERRTAGRQTVGRRTGA